MSRLRQIVSNYLPGLSTAGGSERESAPVIDRDAVRADIKSYGGQTRLAFGVCLAAVVVVFVLACWMVLKWQDDPTRLTAVMTASGVSVMGAIAVLNNLWTKKVKADLLYALAGGLTSDALKAVFETLLKDL